MVLLITDMICRVLDDKLPLVEKKVEILESIAGSNYPVITGFKKEIQNKLNALEGIRALRSKLVKHRKAVTENLEPGGHRFPE